MRKRRGVTIITLCVMGSALLAVRYHRGGGNLFSRPPKDERTVSKEILERQGCGDCHSVTQLGKFGLNVKGQALAHGFEGCERMMERVVQSLRIPEAEWGLAHNRARSEFVLFGCQVCHAIGSQSVGLTETGKQAGNLLHKGCLDMCCPPQFQSGGK